MSRNDCVPVLSILKSILRTSAVTVGLLATVVYLVISNVPESGATIVETVNGKVNGYKARSREGKDYYEFLGIPYAQPPVGDLRFEPPQPPENWTETRNVHKFGSPCLQQDVVLLLRVLGEEDCLFLNVFTPQIATSTNRRNSVLFPVMVFLYGGMFMSGSANMYKGKFFADENIVLVTLNYRVGALGFLSTDDGLKDQNLALRWVKENIVNFGGDPNRVTLFGESAGAASVHYHMLSPMSRGLFNKALSQSGNAVRDYRSTTNPGEQARHLANLLNCPPSQASAAMATCLKNADALDIVETHRDAIGSIKTEYSLYTPVVEKIRDGNTFLPDLPENLLRRGHFNKVPMMIGVNSGEGLIYTARLLNNEALKSSLDSEWNSIVPKLLNYNSNLSPDAAEKIREYYFPDADLVETNIQNISDMYSDKAFFLTTNQAARLQSQYSPVYLYYFNHKTQLSVYDVVSGISESNQMIPAEFQAASSIAVNWVKHNIFRRPKPFYGACHGDELNLLFNTQIILEARKGTADYNLSKQMVKAWAAFARGDKLTLSFQSIPWPPIHPKDATFKYMEIKSSGRLINEPFQERINFWSSLNLQGPAIAEPGT